MCSTSEITMSRRRRRRCLHEKKRKKRQRAGRNITHSPETRGSASPHPKLSLHSAPFHAFVREKPSATALISKTPVLPAPPPPTSSIGRRRARVFGIESRARAPAPLMDFSRRHRLPPEAGNCAQRQTEKIVCVCVCVPNGPISIPRFLTRSALRVAVVLSHRKNSRSSRHCTSAAPPPPPRQRARFAGKTNHLVIRLGPGDGTHLFHLPSPGRLSSAGFGSRFARLHLRWASFE